ncbi:hypothetical protein Tco_0150608 [Tanacetum coccineum]
MLNRAQCTKRRGTAGKDKHQAILDIHSTMGMRRGRRNEGPNDHLNAEKDGTSYNRIYMDEKGASSEVLIRTIGFVKAPVQSKKPDGPSYHITHRIQWRNHLVDTPDFPTSKDR